MASDSSVLICPLQIVVVIVVIVGVNFHILISCICVFSFNFKEHVSFFIYLRLSNNGVVNRTNTITLSIEKIDILLKTHHKFPPFYLMK